MTMTIAWRRVRHDDPQGPLCAAWDQNLAGQWWDGCAHDSCWAILTGGKTS